MATQTQFEKLIAQDTFVVVSHAPSTPREQIAVQAINPDGVTIDAVFTLDQLDGGMGKIQEDIDEDLARKADWQGMRNKVNQTIPV